MSRHPITRGAFEDYRRALGEEPPSWAEPLPVEQPAHHANWHRANAYCESLGLRLPTEAERERAARGDDGRLHPWGNDDGSKPDSRCFRNPWAWSHRVGTHPVAASPYGVEDMVGGHHKEWVADWYGPYNVEPGESTTDPTGPEDGTKKVFRGSGFVSDSSAGTVAERDGLDPDYQQDIGFRCALSGV